MDTTILYEKPNGAANENYKNLPESTGNNKCFAYGAYGAPVQQQQQQATDTLNGYVLESNGGGGVITTSSNSSGMAHQHHHQHNHQNQFCYDTHVVLGSDAASPLPRATSLDCIYQYLPANNAATTANVASAINSRPSFSTNRNDRLVEDVFKSVFSLLTFNYFTFK